MRRKTLAALAATALLVTGCNDTTAAVASTLSRLNGAIILVALFISRITSGQAQD